MGKKIFLSLLLIVSVFSVSITQNSYTIETVPNPKSFGQGWVSDPDNILTAEEKQELNSKIDEIENNTSVQIAIVIIQSIGQAIPKDFATALFQK